LMQRLHATTHRDTLQLRGFGAFVNRISEIFVVNQELVDSHPALVPGTIAKGTTLGVGFEDLTRSAGRFEKNIRFATARFIGNFAIFAHPAQQPLGAHTDERSRDIEGLYS